MTTLSNTVSKPDIIVSDTDYDRLTDLAASAAARLPEVAAQLQAEMDRAEVVADDEAPADAVRMGSTVEFRSDTGEHRTVTLVYPGEADISQNRISILTPIGAALIGLSAGQEMRWVTRDGHTQILTVLSVTQSR